MNSGCTDDRAELAIRRKNPALDERGACIDGSGARLGPVGIVGDPNVVLVEKALHTAPR